MGFRDRTEYKEWRDAVLELFGRKCIICGHPSNIHVHHVKPVHTYPELTFDPKNGVPLCGNCHSQVNGNELEYIDELEQRQRAVLNGEAFHPNNAAFLDEEALREAVAADPTNVELVVEWFRRASSARAVFDFYCANFERIPKCAAICFALAGRLEQLHKWSDVVRAIDAAMKHAERDGIINDWVHAAADTKSSALSKLSNLASDPADAQRIHNEGVEFLRYMVSRFPSDAYLHYRLSRYMWAARREYPLDSTALSELVEHTEMSVFLSPNELTFLDFAVRVFCMTGDKQAALKYAKQSLALVSDASSAPLFCGKALSASARNGQKVQSCHLIAGTLYQYGRYAEATEYLETALRIDNHNVKILVLLAKCQFFGDNFSEAMRVAKLGLLIDPSNSALQNTLEFSERSLEEDANPERAKEREREARRYDARIDPTEEGVVEEYFSTVDDPQEVIDFYNEFRTSIPKTFTLYYQLAVNLFRLERWEDVVRTVDAALKKAGNDDASPEAIGFLGFFKSEALVKLSKVQEAIAVVKDLILRFPGLADLHSALSDALAHSVNSEAPDTNVLEEAMHHAEICVSLEPEDPVTSSWAFAQFNWAASLSTCARDYASALKYGRLALSWASTKDEELGALRTIAYSFCDNGLYKEARTYLRQALKIDEHDVETIGDLAFCYMQEDNVPEAARWSKLGLMLDAGNETCQNVLDWCKLSAR